MRRFFMRKLFILFLAIFCTTSLVWAVEKPLKKGNNPKAKEDQQLKKNGYNLNNFIICDYKGNGKVEKAMLYINKKKNKAIIAILDNGKFIQLGKAFDYGNDISNLEGCKEEHTATGFIAKRAFGVTFFSGPSANINQVYYLWNGNKYERYYPQ